MAAVKLSELPLSSAKRAAVESLVTKAKRLGHFDAYRKQIYLSFDAGVSLFANYHQNWC